MLCYVQPILQWDPIQLFYLDLFLFYNFLVYQYKLKFCQLCMDINNPTVTCNLQAYLVLVQHASQIFIPYLVGLLGIYWRNGQQPRKETNCSSTVTFSYGWNSRRKLLSHLFHKHLMGAYFIIKSNDSSDVLKPLQRHCYFEYRKSVEEDP